MTNDAKFIYMYPSIINTKRALITNSSNLLLGRPVDDVRFPWGICLNPTAALREQFRGNDAFFYFYDPLQHIPDGTKLYDVIAIKEPIVLEDPDLLDEYAIF